MSAFRRRENVHLKAPRVHITEVSSTSVVQNGVNVSMESVSILSPSEFYSRHPILKEDYSIGEQISAGVGLKDIPCSTRLDSSDNLDYEQNETAEEQILEALNKESDNNN